MPRQLYAHECRDLYQTLVDACQATGCTTEHTYALLHEATGSVMIFEHHDGRGDECGDRATQRTRPPQARRAACR